MQSLTQPYVAPIRFQSAELARLSWRKTYFSVSGAFVFNQKLSTLEDVKQAAQNFDFVLRLVPFENHFRAKMLAALSEKSSSETETYGVAAKVDLLTGDIVKIEGLRSQKVTMTQGALRPSEDGEEPVVTLSDDEKRDFEELLSKFVKSQVVPVGRDLFASFFPELSDSWKNRPYTEFKRYGLYPFQAIFPASLPIEREYGGLDYYLEDHYTIKGDNWVVTCVIFVDNPESEQETTFGGFKYDLATKKFKTMSEFPGKFNATEWFKQFDAGSPFALDLLLSERAKFMRSEFARHVQHT